MNLDELKCKIAVVESAERNIESWNNLRNREIAVIPTDSNYYKEFQQWQKTQNSRYDGGQESAPLYISKSKSNAVIDLQVKRHEDFMKPHKEVIDKALSAVNGSA